MLTFESADENNQLEIHGNREGLLRLAKILMEMAEGTSAEHRHLMTKDWGGTGLSGEKQGLYNHLYNHVKIFFRPEK